jgi:hypothetical protein
MGTVCATGKVQASYRRRTVARKNVSAGVDGFIRAPKIFTTYTSERSNQRTVEIPCASSVDGGTT